MTFEQREDVKAVIRYYDKHGRDWSLVVEYLVCKYNGSCPPWIIRTRIGTGYGRRKKRSDAKEV